MKINMLRVESNIDAKGDMSLKCILLMITGIEKKSTPDNM